MGAVIRGIALPARTPVSFVVDGERLRAGTESTSDTVIDGGWLLPGLVDLHSHPGTEKPGDTYDHALFRRHMLDHRSAGVLTVRSPGTADPVADRADEPDLPRLVRGGRWLATPGRFFEGWGRQITEDELPAAAVEEAAGSGWCKIIGDWMEDDPAVPLEVLAAAVSAVHAAGGRVAVHCQTEEGCHNAVHAGADSIEHGMNLDHALLPLMAARGTALVPTLTTFSRIVGDLDRAPEKFRTWIRAGWDGMFPTIRAAHEAGVTVLAGTDCLPCGGVAEEISWLVEAGMPVEAAVGAGSWVARSWLGLPGLEDGGFADVVAYDADPTLDPSVLRRPRQIVLRGNVIA